MTLRTKPVLLLTAGVLTLGACTAPPAGNDPYQRTRSGAFLGGAVGAVTGALVSDNDLEGALIGGAIGAASGAVVGNILDQQAAELRRDMGNDRVQIRNTGEALVVQLPSDILFDVDSAAVRPDLRADLAAHVRRAEAGERVIVTVDGRPAAQLAPISPGGTPDLDDLAAAGLVRRPLRSDRPGPPQDLPLLPIDVSIDQVLADLRGEPPRRRGGL